MYCSEYPGCSANMWEGGDVLEGAYNSPRPAPLSRATAELQKGSEGAKQDFVCFLKGVFLANQAGLRGIEILLSALKITANVSPLSPSFARLESLRYLQKVL